MRTVYLVFWGGIVALILMACTPPTEEQTPAEPDPKAVRVTVVASRDLPIVVNAVGRLIPNREVVVSAEVSGIALHYDADVGATIARKALLVKIDPADYKLALQAAEANLLSARINLPVAKRSFERAQRLLPENVITQELFEKAEAAYKSAQAQVAQLETVVAQARRQLRKTDILSPFAGIVTERLIETGQHIGAGLPVMHIADMKTMRVKIHVNELDYVHVDAKDPVSVGVEAFPGRAFPGRVDKIGVQADSRTNTFEIEVLVENAGFSLKAGLTARVAIRTGVIADALMIPQDTVLFREDRKEIFVLSADDRAEARIVKLGRMDGGDVRVLEGLSPGDRLVVSGAQYLKPGESVVVTP